MAPAVHVPELALEELEPEPDGLAVPEPEADGVPLEPLRVAVADPETDCEAAPLAELCEAVLSLELAADDPGLEPGELIGEFELQAAAKMGTTAARATSRPMRLAG
jgi:hypothetical protein